MNKAYIKEKQNRSFLENYKKSISKMTKPALDTEWDKVRKELNPNCKIVLKANE